MKNLEEIKKFRARVPVTKEWAYLETASTGLIPNFVYEGVNRYQHDRYFKGGDSVWMYGDEGVGTLEMIERSKTALAEMIHCKKEEIAFGQSSTQMFTLVTEGIRYAESDNVVAIAKGWIGNRYAWQKKVDQGLNVRFAEPVNGEVTIDSLIDLCDEHTRAVTLNLVESNTGYWADVNRLGDFCRRSGIRLFVDAVQAAGALQVDVEKSNIDFLVGNDYKWMMNYCGTGYAYIRHDIMDIIQNWGAGWMSDTNRFDTSKIKLTLRDDAGRFEIGYPHADGIYGMGLIAANNVAIGMDSIEEYVCELGDYFKSRVKETSGLRLTYDFAKENSCQIVSIKADQSVNADNKKLEEAKVFAHFRPVDEKGEREMRVSFHYYNNKEDIDRLIDVLKGE